MNKRLQIEYKKLVKEPIPDCVVRPGESLLDCYFCFQGSIGTHFEGGSYMGRLRFPSEYPWKAPAIFMITPNGKFRTESAGPICTSFSHYHPESWNPALSIRTILLGFISMFYDDLPSHSVGVLNLPSVDLKRFVDDSHSFNAQTPLYKELFQEDTKPVSVIIKRKVAKK